MASGDKIRCFLLEPTGRTARYLRRYASGPCPGRDLHNSRTLIDVVAAAEAVGDYHYPDDDLRWPVRCVCGYDFLPSDVRQLFHEDYFRRTDTGEVLHLRTTPPGAMWFADWMPDRWRGPDKHCLVVKTPGGDWVVDMQSSTGSRWTRTGTPPEVTASPSILIGWDPDAAAGKGVWQYHGWLRAGHLVEC